jgi:tricorn protease
LGNKWPKALDRRVVSFFYNRCRIIAIYIYLYWSALVKIKNIVACVAWLATLLLIPALAHANTITKSDEPTLLIRQPAISKNHLAFVYAGDIWLSDRNGKNPQRLTNHPADELAPAFSPDGTMIAFSARYDGNTDVYVMPITGGEPKRLTWHPSNDVVNGWSTDGKRVLFASPREIANGRSNQLYEVSVDGGVEKKLMPAQAFEGKWSADGKRIAYRPYRLANSNNAGWRLHRGGSAPPIWIIDPLSQNPQWEQIPHTNSNDSNPLWAGNDVVFISDRDNVAANLYLYKSASKTVTALTRETVWDVRHAAISENKIVYEVGGRLKELDLVTSAIRELPISITTQALQARPQYKDAAANITSARLSATGKRVLLTARGDVFTVPVKDGSVRNITQTSGVREKDAMWSPDGKRVAYITDGVSNDAMKHSLVLRDQSGSSAAMQTFPLGLSSTTGTARKNGQRGYFALNAFAPDGKHIIYSDNMLNLYAIEHATGTSRLIDNRVRRGAWVVSFSPDSRYLAYAVSGENYMGRIRIYDFSSGKAVTVTDAMSFADNPVFGGNDYLYFTASINTGPAVVGLDMTSQERPVRDGIYALVLASDGKSPMAPRTGDEDDKATDKAASVTDDKPQAADQSASTVDKPRAKVIKPTRIDFEGLSNRVVALPVAERNYDSLSVAADGGLFYIERRAPGSSIEPPDAEGAAANGELVRFNVEERKAKSLRMGVQSISLSADGKKILLQSARAKLEIADANEKLDAKPIVTAEVGMVVDPRAEWQQIFDEAWWMQREFFYDANMHGLDWNAIRQRYLPLVKHVQRREDLNDLMRDMIAELQVGHNNIGGGDVHRERPAQVGLLGADIGVANNRYRINTIYAGDRWNPFMRAPLAAPGLGVKEGDIILAINGREVTTRDNLYAFLENTVGRQVTISIGSEDGKTAPRNIVVQPIASESAIRLWDWIEKNRAYVDKQSNGRVAYVYLPDTGGDGYKFFNRMFFAQVDRDAIIVDDRRNSGGQAANYVTEVLARAHLGGWKDRAGAVFETPGGGIYGPKAMLIDQDAGSGGDFLPYAFKRVGLGPLIGKRTWGGLIGISNNPPLIDGGTMSVPFFRFFTPEKEWRIENEGTAPDIDVELDPLAVNRGQDAQLDAAIKNVMDRLAAEAKAGKDNARAKRVAPPAPAVLGK